MATSGVLSYLATLVPRSCSRESKKAQAPVTCAGAVLEIVKSERRQAYRLGGLILVLVQLHLHLGQFVRQHPLLISQRLELGQYLLGGFLSFRRRLRRFFLAGHIRSLDHGSTTAVSGSGGPARTTAGEPCVRRGDRERRITE